ncbi:MAG TPA: DUF4339 domain-containing protein [bacterium]|nr:DUF4339 domain-containing protein [bacterium]
MGEKPANGESVPARAVPAAYYLAVAGETNGSYTLAEIRRRHLAGELGADTMYHDGSDWRPLAELPGLVPPPPAVEERHAAAVKQAFAADSQRTIATAQHSAKLVIFVTIGVAACVWLLWSATMSRKVANVADVHRLKTQLLVIMSQDGCIDPATGCMYQPPAAAQPKPLPPVMHQLFTSRGFKNNWGHAMEYVSDGTQVRYLVPLGKEKDLGTIVADPYTMGVWLWLPDSGPLTWQAVRTTPVGVIP